MKKAAKSMEGLAAFLLIMLCNQICKVAIYFICRLDRAQELHHCITVCLGSMVEVHG